MMDPQDIINALTEQRNSALNALAMASAENAGLQRRITELEAEKTEESE